MPTKEIRTGGPFLFEEALQLISNVNIAVIVEIGVIRDPRPIAKNADGHSTVRWAASPHRVYCVDTDQRALNITRSLIGEPYNVSLHCEDGLQFLVGFPHSIDLLYVDGPDPDEGGQEFAERIVVNAPMASRSVILIDDCDFQDNGKGKYAIPAAEKIGFQLLTFGRPLQRQALLLRDL